MTQQGNVIVDILGIWEIAMKRDSLMVNPERRAMKHDDVKRATSPAEITATATPPLTTSEENTIVAKNLIQSTTDCCIQTIFKTLFTHCNQLSWIVHPFYFPKKEDSLLGRKSFFAELLN